ncbi:MAG TPA: gamma-glutamylcyclotransferase [Gemmatimonadales bacterium]|nr:gamma-glutamylcyclotransferase [Gemmatimonadales bacterium]
MTSLDDALAEFNTARHASMSREPWASLLDRLAQATFRAKEHLIVYGSLSPGAPNHGRLAPLGGTWEAGWVEGDRAAVGWGSELGFPALRWRPGGARVTAHLLRSPALAGHWAALDQFEGVAYRRILAPFYTDQGLRAVGYLYAAAPAR